MLKNGKMYVYNFKLGIQNSMRKMYTYKNITKCE